VFRAVLICSDGDCDEVFEAYGSIAELEALACDCGCALEIVEVSELAGEPRARGGFELIPLG
jgi:hypothetical protein